MSELAFRLQLIDESLELSLAHVGAWCSQIRLPSPGWTHWRMVVAGPFFAKRIAALYVPGLRSRVSLELQTSAVEIAPVDIRLMKVRLLWDWLAYPACPGPNECDTPLAPSYYARLCAVRKWRWPESRDKWTFQLGFNPQGNSSPFSADQKSPLASSQILQ